MKKLYSLIAAVAFAAVINAQGTETFQTQAVLGTAYTAGTFASETAGVTVNFVQSRDQDVYGISGKGLMLRRSDEPSSVEFVIPNGVGTFTFKYRKAFTGASDRVLAVFVDGVQTTVTPVFGNVSGEVTDVFTSSTTVNKAGSVSVKISYPTGTANGNRQITLDDVSWTASTLAVGDLSSKKINLVKNTNVSNELLFGAKADVQIINMNGQVVKSASVNENSKLNVSSLSKGMYVVTATVDGEKISQKIVKN